MYNNQKYFMSSKSA